VQSVAIPKPPAYSLSSRTDRQFRPERTGRSDVAVQRAGCTPSSEILAIGGGLEPVQLA
jgi:hypothetical protein